MVGVVGVVGVVGDEVDAFVERVARELYKGRGKDDSAKRRTIPESFHADGFNRAWNLDALERVAPPEGFLADLFDCVGKRRPRKPLTQIESALTTG